MPSCVLEMLKGHRDETMHSGRGLRACFVVCCCFVVLLFCCFVVLSAVFCRVLPFYLFIGETSPPSAQRETPSRPMWDGHAEY
jgi:hypothetical protein